MILSIKIENTNLLAKIRKAITWNILGGIVSKFLPVLSSIILAHHLPINTFGLIAFLQSTLLMIQAFASGGVGISATKLLSEKNHNHMEIIRYSHYFSILILIGIMAIFSGFFIFGSIPRDFLSSNLIYLCVLTSFIVAIASLQNSILIGLQLFKINSYVSSFSACINFMLTIYLSMKDHEVGFLLAQFISGFIYIITMRIVLNKYQHYETEVRTPLKKLFSNIFHLSIPTTLSGIFAPILLWFGNIILSHSVNGYLYIAANNIVNQWRSLLLFLPSFAMQALFPIITSSKDSSKKSDDNKFENILSYSNFINCSLTIPLVILVMLFSGRIMSLYGFRFISFQSSLIVAAGTAMIQCIGISAGASLQSNGRMWTGLLINLSFFIIFISLLFVNYMRISVLNYNIFQCLSYIIISFITFILLRRDLKVFSKKSIELIMLASIIIYLAYQMLMSPHIVIYLSLFIIASFFLINAVINIKRNTKLL